MLNKIPENKTLFIYLPLIIYWIILLAATSIPAESVPSLGVSDKFKHFGAYLVLALLLNTALVFQDKYKLLKEKSSLFTLVITIVYGIFDELHQALIPGRSCELLDWIADVSGAFTAVVIFKFLLLDKVQSFIYKK